jgi:hypothetical protein
MKLPTLPARLALLLPALGVASSIALPDAPNDVSLARQIAQGLIAACPPADPGDEKARDLSAGKLTRFVLLRDALGDPIFWGGHSPGLLLIFEKGKIIAAYRSERQDPQRPQVAHESDHRWRWIDKAGHEMPYVALYSYLFSASNPHVRRLDAAYRALETAVRAYSCFVCHSPENTTPMNPLRLLNFPNQALTMRHRMVTQLKQNRMPLGTGIPDATERKKLIELAQEFAAVGDQALDYEGEFKPPDGR